MYGSLGSHLFKRKHSFLCCSISVFMTILAGTSHVNVYLDWLIGIDYSCVKIIVYRGFNPCPGATMLDMHWALYY
jgi:hypothetical protein